MDGKLAGEVFGDANGGGETLAVATEDGNAAGFAFGEVPGQVGEKGLLGLLPVGEVKLGGGEGHRRLQVELVAIGFREGAADTIVGFGEGAADTELELQGDADGTMVGTEELFIDLGGFEVGQEAAGDEEIVNAPADVAFASVRPV